MRRLIILIMAFVIAGSVLPVAFSSAIDVAHAQEAPKRKNLLELLFGGALKNNRAKREQPVKAPAKRVRVEPRQSSSGSSGGAVASSTAPAPQVKAVEKNEDAAKVLVVGDFMASQLAKGLEDMFAENPGLVVVDTSVALSGMVRDDVVDWPAVVGGQIDEHKPIMVIALVGMNDRQQMRTSAGRLSKLSDEWKKVYDERVDRLARTVREKRVPMIWVGLPPVSKGSMNADYLVFNDTYQSAVEAYGGSFVDVWDGFVDEEGHYVRSGPDINGQIVTLRRSDGINMTASGYEKLAFFTEKVLKRMTGFGKDALVSTLVSVGLPEDFSQDQYDPAGTGKTVVVALGSPVADGGTQLEGEEGFLTSSDAKRSSSFDLVVRGVGAQPHEGRIDAGWGTASFALPRGETPEPVLANIRGINLRSFLDELPPLEETSPNGANDISGEERAPASN